MHGVGISPGTTINRPYTVVLDITRLVSRVGQGPLTGVDRVEMAYLDWCLSTPNSLFFCLARVASGYVLLDRSGAVAFRAKMGGDTAWGKPDWRARIGLRTSKKRGAAESDLRRLAIAISGKDVLPEIPAPNGVYFNTGHSNLSETTLSGMVSAGFKVATLIHDMIPLDWPDFQRAGSVPKFEKKMRAVASYSDLIIANSKDTKDRVQHYFSSWAHSPSYVSAHLGAPQPCTDFQDLGHVRPYFVVLGTIEPRKNHALLLDVWEDMQQVMTRDDIPDLYVIGRRGWNNDAVFSRLDKHRNSTWLHERNDMTDTEMTGLLAGAHGLLFPTFAEGFGLPLIEAAQLGVPVICGDLAIHHEVLGDYPVYADLQDRYLWKKIILEQAEQRQKDLVDAHKKKKPILPTWPEHFEIVNAAVTKLL